MRTSSITVFLLLIASFSHAEEATLQELKSAAAAKSKYLAGDADSISKQAPRADLEKFQREIAPILANACTECHGAEKQKAKFRVDTLNPDLIQGEDADWWLEIMDVMSNDEMPPEDGPELADDDREKVIEWLAAEIQTASKARRAEEGHSSFRRMTRYEYNYALQDLLGLDLNFAADLPPDPVSEDGFKNSSEMLQISASQYATYLELNRKALNRATVRGERPQTLYWGISSERAATRKVQPTAKAKERNRGGRARNGPFHQNLKTGETSLATWEFRHGRHAWEPTTEAPEVPEKSDYITVLPAGQGLIVELGNQLPDEGTLRVRFRASRISNDDKIVPNIALEFGWQGSNNSKAAIRVSEHDLKIVGKQFYQWEIPLSEIYPRNPMRKTVEIGAHKRSNPTEYIRLHNRSRNPSADIEIDYIEVSAPVYEQWPPASHTNIFFSSENSDDETVYAREILSRFMRRAWRRDITAAEIDQKLKFFAKIRPSSDDFQQAMIETLTIVLSSPRFLYLVQSEPSDDALDEFELATRLSMFLWCSTPDDELLDLAAKGQLSDPEELSRQTKRLLADPRHERFTNQFVHQWLDMDLLDYLTVDKSSYPDFDNDLKEAMQQEPIAFFEEALANNHSVLDFLHADYAMVNERLAQHYGIDGIGGQEFQKVSITPDGNRGGLLTMAGLLAMNSDGIDSNPLKRGVWILESILNDPPPPPPPAVPEIDLADPEILKMSLKERMEDHRNKPACASCHMKIDPWGVAFENFDAVGSWRSEHRGREIDSMGLLFNQQELDGIEGLKRFLLSNRQDQFARAITEKLTTFALGRPLTFADRAAIEGIVSQLRKDGDGLASLVTLIVTSDLFRSP